MALNIKSDETCQLISRLAGLTGENMTEAVTRAVREKLERLEEENSRVERLRRVHEIVRDASKRFPPGLTSQSVDDLLYDESGLPK